MNHACISWQTSEIKLCVFWITHQPAVPLSLSSSHWASSSLRHSSIEISQLVTLQWPFRHSNERVTVSKSKARNDESVRKVYQKHRLKSRPLVPLGQVVNVKEMFWRKLNLPPSEHNYGERALLLWYLESFSGLDRSSHQPQHPLSQSAIQSKTLTLFNSVKAEKVWGSGRGKVPELVEVRKWDKREEAISII